MCRVATRGRYYTRIDGAVDICRPSSIHGHRDSFIRLEERIDRVYAYVATEMSFFVARYGRAWLTSPEYQFDRINSIAHVASAISQRSL